jgi:hypothetical protein
LEDDGVLTTDRPLDGTSTKSTFERASENWGATL